MYDVVDRTGRRVDRVEVPAGTSIVAFGAGAIVYLAHRSGEALTLVRMRYTPPPPKV